MRRASQRLAQDEHPVLIFMVTAVLVLGSLFLASRVVPGEAGSSSAVPASPTPAAARTYP
jgi:hypothetical protein